MALRTLKNNSPPALTLYAQVVAKDPMTTVKPFLEKALTINPAYTPAVLLLAEHLDQEENLEEEYKLLKRHAELVPSSRVHQLLGDVLMRLRREIEAFEHYTIALRIDPNNQRAQEGLNLTGRQYTAKLKSGYYVTVVSGNSSSTDTQDISTERDPDATEGWPQNQDFEF